MNVVDAWNKLDKVLTRLEKAGGGRVARMGARKAALIAVRQLRAAIDVDYPAVPKKVRRRKTALSLNEWETRLAKRRWVVVQPRGVDSREDLEARFLRCRIPHKALDFDVWAPKWVAMAVKEGKTESQLKSIKKSRREQKALNTLYVATQE